MINLEKIWGGEGPDYEYSSPNLPQQSAIAKGLAEANSVFIVITIAKILPW